MSLHILSPSICPSSSPQHPRGLVCSVEGPMTGLPSLWLSLPCSRGWGSTHADCFFLSHPFQDGRSQLYAASSIPTSMWFFLKLPLWTNSTSFQLVFYKNCSVCGCIFDVFVLNVSTSSYSTILIWTLKIGSFKIFSLYYWKCFKVALFGWKVKGDS